MEPKRPRLHSLLGIPGVSAAGLAEIAHRLREDPELSDATVSQRGVLRAFSNEFAAWQQVVTLKLSDGSDFQWPVASLRQLLLELGGKPSAFREALQSALASVSLDGYA
eukprot:9606300-Alexandrium_andersonii.AAC.1